MDNSIRSEIIKMIDDLKAVCASNGLGNTSSEYKIITEIFLYKFLNDKFISSLKELDNYKNLSTREVEEKILNMTDEDFKNLLLGPDTAIVPKNSLISYLYNNQNIKDFHKEFDKALIDISNNEDNAYLFSVHTADGSNVALFNSISQYIIDYSKKDDFCKALIGKIINFTFEETFKQNYDFFAAIFEYLIKDYNKDFGKYAEYYTPYSIAMIIAKILAPNGDINAKVYDPAAGSGTLILALANKIGKYNCTLYTQDISQKSNEFLRLNLILNSLVHSLPNIVQGDTLINPYHKNKTQNDLDKFDYIVCNPPFKVDFSDNREILANNDNSKRFFAGVPKIPNKEKDKMEIYLMFLQHILYSLNEKGKAAIVVPTGFLTQGSGIGKKIREYIINSNILKGVISMPSNVFANTGTNVSIIFIDRQAKNEDIILIDASSLGDTIKEKNQRTVLLENDISLIVNTFNNRELKEDFSVIVKNEDIKNKNYSFSAGQYFEIKIDYIDISEEDNKINEFEKDLNDLFKKGRKLEKEIFKQLGNIKYE